MLAGIAGKQIQVGLAVAIVEKNNGAIITVLGDMVGITRGDDPGGSRGTERDYRTPGSVARKHGSVRENMGGVQGFSKLYVADCS